MNAQDVRQLYEYNRWANARVLDAASRLTPEQFTKDLASSHRSVRDTLAHILAAEWIWLMRWKGTSPKALLDPLDFPDQDTLRARWDEVEREQTDFLGGVNEESLAAVLGYVNTRGEEWHYPLWQMLQHVANHSTYHRGQAVTLLRQLGQEPASTDFLVFFDEANPRTSPPRPSGR